MKKFQNVQELVDTVNRNNPLTRFEYLMMMLGYGPVFHDKCTIDREDDKIIYGDKIIQHKAMLLGLSCSRLWSKPQYANEKKFSIIKEMFSRKEYVDICYYVYNNYDFYKKHGIIFNSSRDFYYFKSKNLDKSKNDFSSGDVKHRLYLTIGLEERAWFSKYFIEDCVKENMPYYFKVFNSKGQTDTVVIYCDNKENLLKYVNIICDIYDREPRLKKVTKTPPPHLCKVNEYIGYGFEPFEDHSISYTQFMKECYLSVAEKCKSLRNKIENTYRIYGFDKMNKDEKYKFIEKNKKHFYKTFGLEINEILNEIGEQSRLRKEKKNGFSRK